MNVNKGILSVLNSRLFRLIYSILSFEKGRVLAQVKPTILKEIPIRTINFQNPIDKSRQDNLVELVDRMLDLSKKLSNAEMDNEIEALKVEINATDKQIDQLVYKLYGLTDDEIKIVEAED